MGAFVLLLAAIVAIAGRDTPIAQSLAAVSMAIAVVHALVAFGLVDAFAFVPGAPVQPYLTAGSMRSHRCL